MFRFLFLCAVLLLPTQVWCQTNPASPTLTLQQAVDIALIENRLISNEKLEVEKANERIAFTASRSVRYCSTS